MHPHRLPFASETAPVPLDRKLEQVLLSLGWQVAGHWGHRVTVSPLGREFMSITVTPAKRVVPN